MSDFILSMASQKVVVMLGVQLANFSSEDFSFMCVESTNQD